MELALILDIVVIVGVIIICFLFFFFKKLPKTDDDKLKDENLKLEQQIIGKDIEIKNLQQNIEIANAKTIAFEQLKTETTTLKEKLSNTESERNNLRNETTSLKKEEETRNETLRKSIEASNTLQESLTKEKERVNDDRVKEIQDRHEKMKLKWGEHEKDIENHIQLICKNHIIKYISQEDFPYPRNQPDNSIEIMDQLIVFDAKSPANDDLSNFPKYIKLQTESLKKYDSSSTQSTKDPESLEVFFPFSSIISSSE
jgi:DNA repair exonuclease SbcCD ATPase subunit